MKSNDNNFLREILVLLNQIGSANDAEDRGYKSWADKARKESCAKIQNIIDNQPWITEILPGIQKSLSSSEILISGWARYCDIIKRT